MRLRLDSGSLPLAMAIRETGVAVPIGGNGGASGMIEWVGATEVVSGAPQGVLVTGQAGVWQTFTFLPAGVLAFTGDASARPFTVYIDAIEQPCPSQADHDLARLLNCLSSSTLPADPACN